MSDDLRCESRISFAIVQRGYGYVVGSPVIPETRSGLCSALTPAPVVEDPVASFIAAINAHDADGIVSLCTEDHRFIDAHGAVTPPENLLAAWRGYFQFMPHYGIEIDRVLRDSDEVAIFGHAWGGLDTGAPENRSWRRPCAWRARLREGRVSLWQVYVDTKPVFDLL